MSARRWLVGSAAVAVAVVVALAPASPVAAHASLETSVPAANAVLVESPPFVVLDFDEAIETGLAMIQLFDGNGDDVPLGSPEGGADGTQVRASVPPLTDGLYAVVWRVTSEDGHAIEGSYAFQMGAGATGDADALLASVGQGRSSTGLAWRYGVARFLSMAGLVLLLGGGWWAMQRPAWLLAQRRLRVMLVAASGAFVVGSLGAFAFFAASVTDGSLSSAISPSAWSDAAGTTTGQMLLLRGAVAVALAVLLVPPVRATRRPGRHSLGAAGVLGALALVSFSRSGHANAVSPRGLWIAVDAVHLAAVVAWIGGLVALTLASAESRRTPEVQGLALRFSGLATVAVPVVVATGVAQTWRLAGGFGDVTSTTWGRLLLVKVTVLAALLAVAGVSRWLLHREGAASVGRTLVAEVIAAVLVVGLAAGVVAQPPRLGQASRPFEGTLTASGLIASVTVSPGRVGSNEVHILITPAGGSIVPVEGATARVSLPAAGVPISPVTLAADGPNHFSGTVTFTEAGDWTFEVVVKVSATETVLLKATVPIP